MLVAQARWSFQSEYKRWSAANPVRVSFLTMRLRTSTAGMEQLRSRLWKLAGACIPLSDEDFDDETLKSMRNVLNRNVIRLYPNDESYRCQRPRDCAHKLWLGHFVVRRLAWGTHKLRVVGHVPFSAVVSTDRRPTLNCQTVT